MLPHHHQTYKVCAAWLRDKGYSIYAQAKYVPPPNSTADDVLPPDMICLHNTEPPIRVYLNDGRASGIYDNTPYGGRVVIAAGFEDLRNLLTTGRPWKNLSGGLF